MNRGLESTPGVREGDVLAGKYRVERVLGAGGMGVVVAAHHIQLDEKVALKFLLPEALGNADAVGRFVREARAAVKIKSEHVARVIDVGSLTNGAPFIVMEYLDGGDLAAWLKQRGALPIEQAVEFVLQACVAVADAHALGIVHRDLKPANLFCVRRSDGQLSIKVLDFGISKMVDVSGLAVGAATRTSALMGSPHYMSPEQMRSAKDVDAQTDIWSLGVILFELMAARPVFSGDSVTELAIKVANEPTPSIRIFRPDVPSGLEAIIAKCLEKHRRKRYANVAELAVALLEFGPKRAKASVERITGILQAAGLSASALALPPSPQLVVETVVAPGTVAPVGHTATIPARRKTVVRSLAVAVALAAALGSALGFRRVSLHHEPQAVAPQPAAPQAVGGPSITPAVLEPVASVGPPRPPDTPTVNEVSGPAPSIAARPSASAVATPPTEAMTRKRALPSTPATSAAPGFKNAATSATAARASGVPPPTVALPAASAMKCDPPYFFDAKGNRVFKAECL
ncbi:MAG: protein kinase [Polyangiaceae bacterium]|jgi:serine/threonine-protein kinase